MSESSNTDEADTSPIWLSPEYLINDYRWGRQGQPNVVFLKDGRLLFSFHDDTVSAPAIIHRIAEIRDDDTIFLHPEFSVVEPTAWSARNPQAFDLGDGRVLFSYEDYNIGIMGYIATINSNSVISFGETFQIHESDALYLLELKHNNISLEDGRVLFYFFDASDNHKGGGLSARIGSIGEGDDVTFDKEFLVNEQTNFTDVQAVSLPDGNVLFVYLSDLYNYSRTVVARIGSPDKNESISFENEIVVQTDATHVEPRIILTDDGLIVIAYIAYRDTEFKWPELKQIAFDLNR